MVRQFSSSYPPYLSQAVEGALWAAAGCSAKFALNKTALANRTDTLRTLSNPRTLILLIL